MVLARRPGRVASLEAVEELRDGGTRGKLIEGHARKNAAVTRTASVRREFSTEASNTSRINVFTESSAGNEILFTNVNVETLKKDVSG